MVRSLFSSFYAHALALVLTCLTVVVIFLSGAERFAGANPLASGEVYLVNSLLDEVDVDLTDGLCRTAGGACTLRAAVMQANAATGVQTITLPAGLFSLTRTGDDDTAMNGDLDMTDPIVIDGAGVEHTIIDGNGSTTRDRVFHLFGGGGLQARGLTIRNGFAPLGVTHGGGIYCQSATAGLTLDQVVVEHNKAITGGGIAIAGCPFTAVDSTIRSNTASTTTTPFVRQAGTDSRVTSGPTVAEKIIPVGTYPNGGGIYLEGPHTTRIERTQVVSNSALIGGGVSNNQTAAGQGGRLTLINSQIAANRANDGAGIFTRASLQLQRTIVEGNLAQGTGGAVAVTVPYDTAEIDLVDSTLRDNQAVEGGALAFENADNGRFLTLRNSTLSGNIASADGGAIFAPSGVRFAVVDATIDGNTAGRSGGGIAAGGNSRIWLSSVTLTDNRLAPSPDVVGPSLGTGLYLTATAAVTVQNTIIAGNNRVGSTLQPPSECFVNPTTSLRSGGYNLILHDLGCSLSGTTVGNITGVDPELAPLANNGGWTRTRVPLGSRPTYNRGNPNGCLDHQGLPIALEQRGVSRALFGRCDIGAVEYFAFPTLTAVSPEQVPARPDFTLVLTGGQLIPNTVVLWNGTAVPTTFVDGQHLTVTIPTNLVPATGPYPISAQYGTLASPIPSVVTVTVTTAEQSITFGPQPPRAFNDPPFLVSASASSGLPVSFQASGVCSVSGNLVTPTGVGSCTLIAVQSGNALYNAAAPVRQTFPIGPAVLRPVFIPRAGKE